MSLDSMTTTTPLLLLGAVLLGPLSHHLIFKPHEPRADLLLFLLVLLPSLLTLLFPSPQVALLTTAYLVSLFTSIGVYRAVFHPLRRFPGPKWARVSKWWNVGKVGGKKYYRFIEGVHKEFGSVVRIGPNELSFSSVESLSVIYGHEGKLRRGPYFDAYTGISSDSLSIEFCRDRKEHSRLRKIWDRAFSSSSIQSYYSVLADKADQLVEVLLEQSISKEVNDGKEKSKEKRVDVDLTKCLEWMTGDAMGQLGFGEDLGLLTTQSDPENLWPTMKFAMEVVHRQAQVPWSTPLLQWLPVPPPIKHMNDLIRRRIEKRMKRPGEGDVLHYLLGEDVGQQQMKDWDQLLGNCFVVMQAGADTTTTTLLMLMYHVLSHRPYFDLLRAEIDGAVADGEPIHYDAIKNLPFLDACHNEALRILPPFPSNIQRYVDEPGKEIAGEFIPGGTVVSAPAYTLHHNPLYFSPAPDKFLPERWLQSSPRSEEFPFPKEYAQEPFVHHTGAFIPFSQGAHICSGQAFAIMENKLVVASLVKRLEISLGEGFVDQRFWEEMGERMFVRRARLEVRVGKRETGKRE